jgi:hypothetical protein
MAAKYFKAQGLEFFIETTKHQPAGLFEFVRESLTECQLLLRPSNDALSAVVAEFPSLVDSIRTLKTLVPELSIPKSSHASYRVLISG